MQPSIRHDGSLRARLLKRRRGRFAAGRDPPGDPPDPHLEALLVGGPATALDPPTPSGHTVTLAGDGDGPGSGEVRELPSSLVIGTASSSRIPLRPRGITL